MIVRNVCSAIHPELPLCYLREVARFSNGKLKVLCGLVHRVPGYRSRGTGSIPSVTRFSEK
jgi:hypothetical protein